MTTKKIKFTIAYLLVSSTASIYSTLETCNLELDKLAIVGQKLRRIHRTTREKCADAYIEALDFEVSDGKIDTIAPSIAKIICDGGKQCANRETETDIEIPKPTGTELHRYDGQFSWQIKDAPYSRKIQKQQGGNNSKKAFNDAFETAINNHNSGDLPNIVRKLCENYGGMIPGDGYFILNQIYGYINNPNPSTICFNILDKEPCSTPLPDSWQKITATSIPDDWPGAKPKIVDFLANFNPASSDQEIVNYVDQYKEAANIIDSFIATSNRLLQLKICKISGHLPKNNTGNPSKNPICCYGEPKADGTCKIKAEYCAENPTNAVCS